MMRYLLNRLILIGFSICFLTFCSKKEPEKPDPVRRKSPVAIAKIKHAGTYIKIVYGQPYKRERKIFGGLVPYGEVWRTGANEATEMTTTGDITFGDKALKAGTYELFTIPHTDSWTIVLNSDLGQWGAFEYNKSFDVMRTTVSSKQTEHVAEALTIQFGKAENDSTSILIQWDNTEVQIPIRFTSQPASST